MIRPEVANRIVKTQRIRVLDVVLIGPLMYWGGAKLQRRHPVAGSLLALFGVSTVIYNARNWQRVQASRRRGL